MQPLDTKSCFNIHSVNTQRICIGIAIITSIAASILLALGAVGLFTPAANLAALSAGGVVLILSLGALILLCIKICSHSTTSTMQEDINKPSAPLKKKASPREINEAAALLREINEELNLDDIQNRLLPKAISAKNMEAFRAAIDRLIVKNRSIATHRYPAERSIFHLIAHSGMPEMVDYLINAGVEPDHVPASDRYSELHYAIFGNNHKVIPAFLSLDGFNVNAQDESGNTPLHYAVAGHLECVRALVNNLTPSNTPDLAIVNNEDATAIDVLINKHLLVNTANFKVAEFLAETYPQHREFLKAKMSKIGK